MGKILVNFLVVVSVIIVSVPALATKYNSNEQQPGPSPKCRTVSEICSGYADYACCEGLTCVGWKEHLPPGFGVCTSLGQPPQSPPEEKCQKMHQVCRPYGKIICCEGLHCVDTGRLPGGDGFCEAISL